MSISVQNQRIKKSLWAVGGVYALITLEFIYMATPFAAFFYSVYSPILNFTNRYQSLAWLNNTFLPHIVRDTSSYLLNQRESVGIALFMIGLLGFTSGVVQVYFTKLFSKKAVIGGLYRFIRHPQYLFLMIWGLGLVLLWPRTIVLLFFVTMIFIYYRLARIEENECERKFGETYRHYKDKTGMFIPAALIPHLTFSKIAVSKSKRRLLYLIMYTITIVAIIVLSAVASNWSLDHLYAIYEKDMAYISITKMDDQILHNIINCTLVDTEVQRRLTQNSEPTNTKYINYILPADLFMLEIPMSEPEDAGRQHFLLAKQSANKIKIIFTRAELRGKRNVQVQGKEILKHVTSRTPVLEVYIDLTQKKILEIKDPLVRGMLGDITMPVY